ncbi:hypothetical protein L596_015680 [Steinernema carpocapsae]|uniref:CCR4-Not complex component Not1 C-terminal domain-containing protein n=1 Tax=Steinernema carpocapsae TaxID=34508 RepID=A0A4U5NFP2_STECR|nr:hypothetical protein L596_015680 [Steinernema carpocapsae]
MYNKLICATLPDDVNWQPDVRVAESVKFILNNLQMTNVLEKVQELRILAPPENAFFSRWLARQLLMTRVFTQPNFLSTYYFLLIAMKCPEFEKHVRDETYRQIRRLLTERASKTISDRQALKNLGTWLGFLTLARNKPMSYRDLNLGEILKVAQECGDEELGYVVPLITKILRASRLSTICGPESAYTGSLLKLLVDLHKVESLKLNVKFEIEILFRALSVTLDDSREAKTNLRFAKILSVPLAAAEIFMAFHNVAGDIPEKIPGIDEELILRLNGCDLDPPTVEDVRKIVTSGRLTASLASMAPMMAALPTLTPSTPPPVSPRPPVPKPAPPQQIRVAAMMMPPGTMAGPSSMMHHMPPPMVSPIGPPRVAPMPARVSPIARPSMSSPSTGPSRHWAEQARESRAASMMTSMVSTMTAPMAPPMGLGFAPPLSEPPMALNNNYSSLGSPFQLDVNLEPVQNFGPIVDVMAKHLYSTYYTRVGAADQEQAALAIFDQLKIKTYLKSKTMVPFISTFLRKAVAICNENERYGATEKRHFCMFVLDTVGQLIVCTIEQYPNMEIKLELFRTIFSCMIETIFQEMTVPARNNFYALPYFRVFMSVMWRLNKFYEGQHEVLFRFQTLFIAVMSALEPLKAPMCAYMWLATIGQSDIMMSFIRNPAYRYKTRDYYVNMLLSMFNFLDYFYSRGLVNDAVEDFHYGVTRLWKAIPKSAAVRSDGRAAQAEFEVKLRGLLAQR